MEPSIAVAFIALAGTVATVAGGVAVAYITSGRGTQKAAETATDKTIEEAVASAILAEKVNTLLDENAELRNENEELRIENALLRKGKKP